MRLLKTRGGKGNHHLQIYCQHFTHLYLTDVMMGKHYCVFQLNF